MTKDQRIKLIQFQIFHTRDDKRGEMIKLIEIKIQQNILTGSHHIILPISLLDELNFSLTYKMIFYFNSDLFIFRLPLTCLSFTSKSKKTNTFSPEAIFTLSTKTKLIG